MNSRMLLFHPAFEEDRKDIELREEHFCNLLGYGSVSETVRRLVELELKQDINPK